MRLARLVESFEGRLQLGAEEVFRERLILGIGDGHAQRDDLWGEVLGIGKVALGTLTVLLDLHAVAVILPVLREKDQGRSVRRLQRKDQREQSEVRGTRVELPRHGGQ